MPWVRIDENLPEHPKLVQCSATAAWLYVAALCWCSRNLTDGHVPRSKVPSLVHVRGALRAANELVECGLWEHEADAKAGYFVHDYLDFQPSAHEIKERRKQDAERKRGVRLAKLSPPDSEGNPPGRPDGLPADVRSDSSPRVGASQPSPAQPGTSQSAAVANGVTLLTDLELRTELEAIGFGGGQVKKALGHDRYRVSGWVAASRSSTVENRGAFLNSGITSGAAPPPPEASPSDRLVTACISWVKSPAFDPETMDLEIVLEEIERKQRKLGGELDPLQKQQVVHVADERIEAHAARNGERTT